MTILFFTASWCGVCKSMYPVWNKMVEHNSVFDFETVDCSEDVEKARAYNVSNLPTFIATDGSGTPVDKRQGYMNEATFQKWLDSMK